MISWRVHSLINGDMSPLETEIAQKYRTCNSKRYLEQSNKLVEFQLLKDRV